MKKLVTVINDELKEGLSENKDITLLYPLKSFCVGFDKYYDINSIDDFVLVNRLLNDEELDQLSSVLENSKIKGIVFDDLGILEIIKDLPIIKIALLDHIACSTSSINAYLDYVDSVVVSTDLTREEIQNILKNAKKPLVIPVFELKRLMYSRRLLLSNYAKHYNKDKSSESIANIDDYSFIIKENEFGTCFYAKKYFNALEFLNTSNVAYFWYNLIDMSSDDALELILNNKVLVDNTLGFLDKPTTYKLKDDEK